MKYPHMFSPITSKGVTFKNRVMASPATTDRTVYPGGTPTQECIHGYETRARGGVAAVTITESFIDEEEIFSFLKKRQGILDGVCVTGGEPTLQKDLKAFLKRIKELGYEVKLDGKKIDWTRGENNRLSVMLPAASQGELTVRYAGVMLWRIADLISLATLIALCIFCWRRFRVPR